MLYAQQEKPVTTKHPVLGDIEFKVEVPQAQSAEECATMCGGADGLVSFTNSQIATNAKNAARAYARGFEVPKETDPSEYQRIRDEIAKKGQQLAHDYAPSTDTERGPSKAKKAQAFDQIAALMESGQDFTKEDLFKILAAGK